MKKIFSNCLKVVIYGVRNGEISTIQELNNEKRNSNIHYDVFIDDESFIISTVDEDADADEKNHKRICIYPRNAVVIDATRK